MHIRICVALVLSWALAVLLLTGCSYAAPKRSAARVELERANAGLLEVSRELTTGALDAVTYAPPDPAIALARDLLEVNQGIVGAPTNRIPVPAVIAREPGAITDLETRQTRNQALLAARAVIQGRLQQAEERLIEMGAKYEEQRNRSIVRRVWAWAVGTLGLGGLIALVVLCPAVLPLLGAALGRLVAWLPKLAGFVGVVGKQAFDAVVQGVGEVRRRLKLEANLPGGDQPKYAAKDVLGILDAELREATDQEHRDLIDKRREVLRV